MASGNDIVVISSLVSRGGVGARATTFALERLGFRVWLVPTTILPHHPGHGPASPIVPPQEAFAAFLDDLARDEWLAGIKAIVTGYFSSSDQIASARSFIDRARGQSPDLTYLCDPIIGDMIGHGSQDQGRLYVPEGVAAAIGDQLLPRADIATPNRFEAGWFTGENSSDFNRLASAFGSTPAKQTLITGVPGLMRGTIGTALIEDSRVYVAEHRFVESALKGTGDVFCGLYLGHSLKGQSPIDALKLASAGTYEALNWAQAHGLDELDLPAAQDTLIRPHSQVAVREMKITPAPVGTGTGHRSNRQWVAGVDGCKAGWVAVFRPLFAGAEPVIKVFSRFEDILETVENPAIIAVDMPIGLPDRAGPGGRGPESLIRAVLGERQSSVFSIPSRAAIACEDYWTACTVALETSDPPRKVSKQAFNLFPKIRELDAALSKDLAKRVFEVHPELAYWRLNDEKPASLPKKIRSRSSPDGLDERRDILARHGFDHDILGVKPPRGVGADDVIDAAVNALIAERIWKGQAKSFPSPPDHDSRGLPIAIWA